MGKPTPIPAEDGEEPAADPQVLMDLLFKHRLGVIQDFLKSKGLPYSGTRKKVEERLRLGLSQKDIRRNELLNLIDRIEGWGNQHVYLYRAPADQIARWTTEAKARANLRPLGYEHLFNARRPLLMPVNPQLCGVEWTPERVRFIWVERRIWYEHLPDEDYTRATDGIEFTARRVHRGRGLIAFDWDLVSGHAALLIQRLPSGNNYKSVKAAFEAVLTPLVKVAAFNPVYISGSILKLERSKEVVRRSMEMVTGQGGKIKFTSGKQRTDAFTDPDLKNARTALGQQLAGRHANFTWPVPDDAERSLHVKLYAPDQRLGIFGECSEGEVRHVLCRVRHHSG